ncbi:MAG TPA: arginase family protein [Chthoniobacterales bacterium]|nr:arginase family protein [Chthoniobacterales bacterium]
MEIRLLLVPYDSGQRNVRMGAGPEHLRGAGLEKRLVEQEHLVDSQVIEPASKNWRAEVQTSFELMRAVAEQVRAARAAGRFPLVLSGNCLSAVGTIAALGPRTGVIWIDAHGDFNTPQTTMSGFLDGMTLATATGRCWVELARSIEGFEPVPDSAVVLIGAHDLDPGEGQALGRSGIVRLSVQSAPNEMERARETLGPTMERFYLHLDLDALDPSEGRANGYAARGGFTGENLQKVLTTVARHLPIAAMTIASYDPAYDTEQKVCAIAVEAAATVFGELAARTSTR